MQLANPWAFWALLLALPLIAMYLLRTRPRRQQVSTVLFWQTVIPATNARRWWRRLRHPLSLLVQLLLLALMVLALADFRRTTDRVGRRRIVVLDNSASMQATDVLPNRLSQAKQRVRQLISSLEPEDEMLMISAAADVQPHGRITSQKSTLRQWLDQVPASAGPQRLGEAIKLAGRLCRAGSDDEIWVVSDPGGREAEESSSRPADVHWIVCGQPAANAAITQFQVRRQRSDPTGFECWVEVTQFGDESLDGELQIELNDRLLDVIPVHLSPGASESRELQYLSAEGGVLKARLSVSDALPVDNLAVASLPASSPCSVTLVTPGNRYLESVLGALPWVDLTVQSRPPESWPMVGETVWILHQTPIDSLPPGKSMVVQPMQDSVSWQVGAPIPPAMILALRPESSLLAHVQLADLLATGAHQLQLPTTADVLASTVDGHPICAIVPHEQGETLLLNVDLQAGDFAWRTAFPVFMSNAMNWLCGQTSRFQPSYAAGDYVSLREGELGTAGEHGVWQITPPGETESGQTESLSVEAAGRSQFGPLDRVGIWRFQHQSNVAADEASTWDVACNVVNATESDLSRGRGESPLASSSAGHRQPLWRWFLAIVLLSLSGEWWLYRRRWID